MLLLFWDPTQLDATTRAFNEKSVDVEQARTAEQAAVREIRLLQRELEKSSATVSTLAQAHEQLEARITQLQTEQFNATDSFGLTFAHYHDRIAQLGEHWQAAERRAADSQAQLSQALSQVASLTHGDETHRETVQNLQFEVVEANQESARLRLEVQTAQAELDITRDLLLNERKQLHNLLAMRSFTGSNSAATVP